MRVLYSFLIILVAATAAAQFNPRSITQQTDSKVDTLRVDVRQQATQVLNFKVYNEAYDAYLREMQRKFRNRFSFKGEALINQAGFSNWAAGGNNTFAARASVNARHDYVAGDFNVNSIVDAAYAWTTTNDVPRKSEDFFNITSTPSLRISPRFEVSFSFVFRSQFTNSYLPPADTLKVSSFLAPAYMTTALGLKYNNTKKTLEIFFAPSAGNLIMIFDPQIRDGGRYGEAGKQYIPAFINYFRIAYIEKLLDGKMDLNLKFESFWDYRHDTPRIITENSVAYRLAKFFTTKFYIKAIYDDTIRTPKSEEGNYLQINEQFGFGFAYVIASKQHPAPPEAPRKNFRKKLL